MTQNTIEVGQQYKCKRRGHVLTVLNVSHYIIGDPQSEDFIRCRSSSGKIVNLKGKRLLASYRFEQIVQPAKITAPAEEVAHAS